MTADHDGHPFHALTTHYNHLTCTGLIARHPGSVFLIAVRRDFQIFNFSNTLHVPKLRVVPDPYALERQEGPTTGDPAHLHCAGLA